MGVIVNAVGDEFDGNDNESSTIRRFANVNRVGNNGSTVQLHLRAEEKVVDKDSRQKMSRMMRGW